MGANHEYVRGERISLSKPSRRKNLANNTIISSKRIRNRYYAPHNKAGPVSIESHFVHDCLKVTPFHSIVSLAYVELQCCKPKFAFGVAKLVHAFVANKYIVRDESPWNEGTLAQINDMVKYPPESVSNNSDHYLVAHIAKANGAIVFHGSDVSNFRYEGNNGGVPIVHAFPLIEHFKDFL